MELARPAGTTRRSAARADARMKADSSTGLTRFFLPAMAFPLNLAQREAVRYQDGPLLVLAGAGRGKTRVIAAKIGHLIACGHHPEHVVAITFTNRAAREMRE